MSHIMRAMSMSLASSFTGSRGADRRRRVRAHDGRVQFVENSPSYPTLQWPQLRTWSSKYLLPPFPRIRPFGVRSTMVHPNSRRSPTGAHSYNRPWIPIRRGASAVRASGCSKGLFVGRPALPLVIAIVVAALTVIGTNPPPEDGLQHVLDRCRVSVPRLHLDGAWDRVGRLGTAPSASFSAAWDRR